MFRKKPQSTRSMSCSSGSQNWSISFEARVSHQISNFGAAFQVYWSQSLQTIDMFEKGVSISISQYIQSVTRYDSLTLSNIIKNYKEKHPVSKRQQFKIQHHSTDKHNLAKHSLLRRCVQSSLPALASIFSSNVNHLTVLYLNSMRAWTLLHWHGQFNTEPALPCHGYGPAWTITWRPLLDLQATIWSQDVPLNWHLAD